MRYFLVPPARPHSGDLVGITNLPSKAEWLGWEVTHPPKIFLSSRIEVSLEFKGTACRNQPGNRMTAGSMN